MEAQCSILKLFRLGSARLGSGRLTCDYNAISVQLQLQLPTGTELGKTHRIEPIYDNSNNSRTQYPDRKDHKEVRYNIETRTYMGDDREM